MSDTIDCYEDDAKIPCSLLQEDQFINLDRGELISEILQIAACLQGSVTRVETLDHSGRMSKKIIIEYDIKQKDEPVE